MEKRRKISDIETGTVCKISGFVDTVRDKKKYVLHCST